MRSRLAPLISVLLAGCSAVATPTGVSQPVTATPPDEIRGTPAATGAATATSSPTPSPAPTPTPDPAEMTLEVRSCNGGTVLNWTPTTHPDFHHYVGLRSPEREIAPQYPPIAPAVDWGDLYATDRFVTSGHDATVVPSATEWHYRVVAYDARGRPVSRSNVASGRILPHGDLGEVRGEPLPDGTVRLTWEPFDGDDGCFSAYRVLQGTGGIAGTLLTSISDRTITTIETALLDPGLTYTVRVVAVRATTLGHVIVAESEALMFTVPAR